jgi:hypothetical protein
VGGAQLNYAAVLNKGNGAGRSGAGLGGSGNGAGSLDRGVEWVLGSGNGAGLGDREVGRAFTI